MGHRAAHLFRAVGAEVWVYDPYFPAERAAALGVRKADLDTMRSTCPVIPLHLPVTDETHHLLGARELALIQDHAVLVDTARSWVIDQDALLADIPRRFWMALDVFERAPAADHALRRLDNVLLTRTSPG